jgi:hypothetical protein
MGSGLTVGAYGLRLVGFDGGDELAVRDGEGLPAVELRLAVGPVPDDPRVYVRADRASFPVGRGRVEMDRHARVATMRSTIPLETDEVVHPWLSRVAGMFGRWLGRDVLHGGAFVVEGRAWALLGGNEAGKSTLLAALTTAGACEVLTDDVLVTERGLAYAGPRCIDLRPDAAPLVGAADAGIARGGTRRRLSLEPVPAAFPLGGVVHLRWGDRLEALPLALEHRLAPLRVQGWLGEIDPIEKHALLGLVALPTLELVRRRGHTPVEAATDLLLDAVRAATSAG